LSLRSSAVPRTPPFAGRSCTACCVRRRLRTPRTPTLSLLLGALLSDPDASPASVGRFAQRGLARAPAALLCALPRPPRALRPARTRSSRRSRSSSTSSGDREHVFDGRAGALRGGPRVRM
jgi:hypothetical protein